MNQPAKMMARTEAAAGGMLSSWLRGRPAKLNGDELVSGYVCIIKTQTEAYPSLLSQLATAR